MVYPEDLIEMIQLYEPGDIVALEVLKAGVRTSLDLTLGATPKQSGTKKWALIWEENHLYLGLQSTSLTPQLAEFFGVKSGILVKSVRDDSPAQAAGLKAGDIIETWNKKVLRDNDDYSDMREQAQPDQVVNLTVFHKGKRRQVSLTPGSRRGFFLNPKSPVTYYDNKQYLVLPEDSDDSEDRLSNLLFENGKEQELKNEVERLRREIDELKKNSSSKQRGSGYIPQPKPIKLAMYL